MIFDFDGTLADSFPYYAELADALADVHGFRRIAAEQVELLRRSSMREIMRELGVPLWKLPLLARDARRMTARHVDRIRLFEGVEPMLRQLAAAGVVLALVTSNSYANVRRVLGPELSALFRYYECGTALFGKRARFRRIRKQTGEPAEAILCVGDELRDLEAAHSERLHFGAVAWGFQLISTLEARAPAEVFRRVDEIVPRLLDDEPMNQ